MKMRKTINENANFWKEAPFRKEKVRKEFHTSSVATAFRVLLWKTLLRAHSPLSGVVGSIRQSPDLRRHGFLAVLLLLFSLTSGYDPWWLTPVYWWIACYWNRRRHGRFCAFVLCHPASFDVEQYSSPVPLCWYAIHFCSTFCTSKSSCSISYVKTVRSEFILDAHIGESGGATWPLRMSEKTLLIPLKYRKKETKFLFRISENKVRAESQN